MTLAEQYRKQRPKDYANPAEWANWLFQFDPTSGIQATELGPVIMFSDGSKHLLDRT